MLLQLPGGWTPLVAPDSLPLFAKWQAVKDDRLPAAFKADNEAAAHASTADNIDYQPEPEGTDNWQTPTETLAKQTGDCEDFCLFYRALLLNGGFADSDLWLLILFDLVARQDHALLWTPSYYLDCRARIPLAHSNFYDYRPICAFAANKAVIFGRKK